MSRSGSSRRRGNTFIAGALAAFALVAASALIADPASAHDELISTDPVAGATVEALPGQLTLTFSGILSTEPGATQIAVTDATGAPLMAGTPVVQDAVVSQPLTGAASGPITVLWKVVSSDGHPISGEYSFTVTAPAPVETPTPTTAPTETAVETPTATPAPAPTAAPPADESSDAPWAWIIGILIVLGIAGGVTYLLVSRRRREKALTEAAASAHPAAGPGKTPPADR